MSDKTPSLELDSWPEAREALRHRDLRQALYDEGHRIMSDVIVNLHGQDHLARRRLENRLFRRDTFAWYEQEHIPPIVDSVLAPAIDTGHGELLTLAKRTMVRLSVGVAGVDLAVSADRSEPGEGAAFERLCELMDDMARAATVVHATGDKAAIIAKGDAALASFGTEFFEPSKARRVELLQRFASGEIDECDLPLDVLTTLLRNHDQLKLSPAQVLQETAYYPWVGSHSTSGQLVHAMHHLFEAIEHGLATRDELVGMDPVRQRFVHESMRLHPASPVAVRIAMDDVTLSTGRTIAAGDTVTIGIERANRDATVWGDDADEFNPHRVVPKDVPSWGLSFGHGTHACLGRELAAGLEPGDAVERRLLGVVTLMSGRLLAAGAQPDPDDPATRDKNTTRPVWGRYPVTLGAGA